MHKIGSWNSQMHNPFVINYQKGQPQPPYYDNLFSIPHSPVNHIIISSHSQEIGKKTKHLNYICINSK